MKDSENCGNCAFYRANERTLADIESGICRRYPPIPMILSPATSLLGPSAGVGMAGVSSPVDADFGCGEFKAATVEAANDD